MPTSPDEISKTINEWLQAIRGLTLHAKVVVGLYVLVVAVLLIAAYFPDPLQLVEFDAAKKVLVYTERWHRGVLAVAAGMLVLLLLYGFASSESHALKAKDDYHKKGAYVIYAPESFAEQLDLNFFGENRGGWGQRAVYAGVDGAKSWLAVSLHSDYRLDPGKLRACIDHVLKQVDGASTVISLGPGDGKTDTEVLASLMAAKAGSDVGYVPIDISEGLLLMTMKEVKQKLPRVRMPFGVLGDFEYGWNSFSDLFSGKELSPRMFVVLGNTVANLDEGLESFFKQAWASLQSGDYLLFDILLGDFDERLGAYEPGKCYDANALFPSNEVMSLYKWFIAQGARRITGDHSVYADSTRMLAACMQVERTKNKDPLYDQLRLVYRSGGVTKTVFKWRRYLSDTSKLETWLKTSLDSCTILATSEMEDDGEQTKLMLLRKGSS